MESLRNGRLGAERVEIRHMTRYLCPTCSQVVKFPNAARFVFCPACRQPLASFDRLPEIADAAASTPTGAGAEPALSGARLHKG
jgi:hypothetical protein